MNQAEETTNINVPKLLMLIFNNINKDNTSNVGTFSSNSLSDIRHTCVWPYLYVSLFQFQTTCPFVIDSEVITLDIQWAAKLFEHLR